MQNILKNVALNGTRRGIMKNKEEILKLLYKIKAEQDKRRA